MSRIGGLPLPALPDIDDVPPLTEADRPCFDDLRAVLAEHGMLGRFGIALLHEHFEVADDEILVETIDVATRTLVSRPEKIADLGAYASVETSWRLDDPDTAPMARCTTACRPATFTESRHKSVHVNR
ncbi:hypothetical protein UO65_3905 [Actinokineospora spheciospongiae]|uniref:Uncharacterized protein n=1 Tax=Actinokineospora spheciospongiae TaxID=909613 RepID=W7J3P7_9PSEU|nr:hypothetical protein [Actinokineospora spheciospongiae]EWC60764.1 hypothetical protein UO65_3905 [Actinokineospora spheciospongiae]